MRVEKEHTADHFRNAGVQVLATPVLCYWFEAACTQAIAPFLDSGEATVGTRLSIEHLAATPLGMRVTVDAEVTGVSGRRVDFTVRARDEKELVARGSHQRFVVDLDRFLQASRAKAVTTG
jgi:predicted thioesterase